MKKTGFVLIMGIALLTALSARAQLAFWNYDDGNQEAPIPAECDGVFDENRGGVFMPTAEEMRERGEAFLLDVDPTVRNKAGYCLIAAAVLGNVPAQYRVAQLYSKGFVLPQDDLSAYRWAFLASLNGHEEAERLALILERFLTTQEIELATASITQALPGISSRYRNELEAQQRRGDQKQAELDRINEELDMILGLKTKKTDGKPRRALTAAEQIAQRAVPHGTLFSEADRR